MLKRVLAWVLLAGFVLLLLNIVFFHVFQMQSVAVYAVIAIGFVFLDKTAMSRKSKISDEIMKKINDDETADSINSDAHELEGTEASEEINGTEKAEESDENKG